MKKSIASFAAALAVVFAGAIAAPSEAEARESCSLNLGNNGLNIRCNFGNRGGFNSQGFNNFGGNHGRYNDPYRDWERQQRQCENMAINYYKTRERLYYQGRDGLSYDERRTLQRMEDNMARKGCSIR